VGNEMSKAAARREKDWRYANRWFVGKGLDIGCGYDVLPVTNQVTEMQGYDTLFGHKNAQYLPEIEDCVYDFVVSSHCLEHMVNPSISVVNWLRVLKIGGFLVVTIPEWELYEHKHWPSKFNGDHKHSFTMRSWREQSTTRRCPSLISMLPFLQQFADYTDVEMLQMLTEHYDLTLGPHIDQTGSPAECAIEFVLRKTDVDASVERSL
jgi:ubiquinone/menaquinone biosynthesis C-methylase UbiE